MLILSRKDQLPVNTVRRINSGQQKHAVIVTPHARAPIVSGLGTSLNSSNVPTTSAPHVSGRLQRKIG